MANIVDPYGREAAAVRRLGVTFDGMNVLDVGCGHGRTALLIARTAESVLGLDPDPERIAIARAALPETGSGEVLFLVEDAVGFDRPPRTFDAVVFTRSL